MANKQKASAERLQRRKWNIRASLSGTSDRPRLSIFRSEKHIYAQVIDDIAGHTLAAASDLEAEIKERAGEGATKSARAKTVGQIIAERARAAGIETVVFDRGGFLYHGRVKAVAEGAREGGLVF